MRITIDKKALLDGAQSIMGVIGSKNTLPILSNILIETDIKNLKLTTTDLDIGITTTIPADVLEEGAITTPAKRFTDIIKELPDAKIELKTKKNNTVVLECNNITLKVLGIPKEEFPKLTAPQNKEELILKQADLKQMLNKTTFAISRDETRYVLNGVCFVVTKEFVKIVATDGRRLAVTTKNNNTNFKTETRVIIPAKTTQELARLLKEEGEVKIVFSKNQAAFYIDATRIISRLIEGDFPNYEQVIPKETDKKIRVNKELLQAAIKRASLLTTPESQAIELQLQKNRLVISKITPEIGEAKEAIDAEYSGEDLLVGFNPAYLLDVLKNIDEEMVEMELVAPEKPGVIRVNNNYLYVVTPMQIG